jgi:zinc ribbon protein
MFCPRCGAQNKLEQKFCRNCGLSLPSVRLALEGKIDEAKAELKQSHDKLGGAYGTLGICVLLALGNALLGFEWGAAINLILGAVITIGWFLKGSKQMDRVLKTLEGKEQEQVAGPAGDSTTKSLPQAELPSAAVPDTDPLLAQPTPHSITEHTTLELKKPETP